ncbi:insulinase family protein [Neolewinella persica]|uniref:insulinase family protein n=1 Tax=Neolewinella persica TaxID=70998 RepID=UPI0003A1A13B|nr:insulinase family protein [Neolewinella persica]
MQRLLMGLMVLFLAAACSTPQATKAPMADKPMEAKEMMDGDFRAEAPAPGPAPVIKLGDFQDFKLDNGLQVVLVENHKLPRVSYQLFVDVPPIMEGKYAGVSSMMGSMLRRATSTKSKEELDEAIDFIGATLSTGGSGAYAATISKYKETLMDMMAEVVLDARFPEEEFAKVKSEAEANLQSTLNNPGAIAARVQSVVTYGKDHPYGELQTAETLKNITLEEVKDFYDTYFVPNRSYLVMVGDLTRAEAEKLAKDAFSSWKAKDVMVKEFDMPKRPSGVTVNFVPRTGAVQSNIIISHPVDVKPGSDEAIPGSMVNLILGSGSFNSRLFQNLREDKAYTYGAGSSLNTDEVVGSFSASSDVRNEVTDSAVTQFMLELAKISSEPVTAKELASTKSLITGSFGRALESPQRIARYALNTIRYGLDRDYYPTYLKKVESTSANDLLNVSRMAMSPTNTNIIVVGDKAVAEKLAKFATSGKINYLDVNGEPINMEEMAAPTDLTAKSVIMGYVDAIGGADAIAKVKNYALTMEADVQGQTLVQTMVKENGTKFNSQTMMMGMVMADQRYNGGKAKMMQQGQTMPDSPELTATMAEQAALFPIVELMNSLDKVSVTGTEMVDGKPAVVLTVEGETGDSQHFFDKESMLEVRMVKKQGPQTVTMNYGDYREIGGVKMPYSMKMSGMLPFPIEMKVTKAKVNTEIDQSLFSVE